MTYSDALQYIHSLLRFGIKPGLSRIRRLCALLGDPQNNLRFVHVAGTNGKGSICAMLSQILQTAGYRTGLYTSPYLTDFCERMQVNSRPIGHPALAERVEAIRPLIEQAEQNSPEDDPVTEFEAVTAIAFDWFCREHCDVVVLEVGLGGRFDATNVIDTPLVSVIGSISLDHTAILGKTVQEIAYEKSGIIKSGGATVCYPDQPEEALAEILKAAAREGNTVSMPNPGAITVEHEAITGSHIVYGGLPLSIPFAGAHQHLNTVTAAEAVRILPSRGLPVPEDAITRGIAAAKWPARVEVLCEAPLVILDGAHNPDGVGALLATLDTCCPGIPVCAVVGMFEDKDHLTAMQMLAPRCRTVLCVQPPGPRALPTEQLRAEAAAYCTDTRAVSNYETAIVLALEAAAPDGLVLLCGSLALAGEIRPVAQALLKKE